MTETLRRYNSVAMTLHWVIAILLIGNLVLGLCLDEFKGQDKFAMFQLHKSIGITVLLLSVFRLVWRLMNPPPPLPQHLKKWEKIAAETTYVLFYAVMLALPFTGWLIVSASPMNLPTMLFGVIPWPHLPFFEGITDAAARKELQHQFGEIHELLANGTIALLLLHLGAAIRHHFLLRDQIVFRMTPSWAAGLLKFIRGERA